MKAGDDQELLQNAIQGDRRAFNEIVNKYKQRIYFTAMKMVRNKDDAYDITQDVFIKAYRNMGNFKGDSNLFTWLYRITVNTSLNYKSRDKFRGMTSVQDMETTPESPDRPDNDFVESRLMDRLDKAVARLPNQQKSVFVMRYYNQMTHSEIARIMNRSEGAVKANYFQALKKIRSEFADILSELPN